MLEVRRQQVDFKKEEKYWLDNNKIMTHTMNGLSLLFPQGERFFVDSVRYYRDTINNKLLQQEIKGFIGQEAMHSLQHIAMNNILTDQGMDIQDVDQHLKVLLNFAYKLPKKHQLAITCALEHITAMMASMFLERDDIRESMTKTMQKLWVWHAIEESEHRAVTYDLYNEIGGSYPLRCFYLIASTIALVVFSTYVIGKLVMRDKQRQGLLQYVYGVNKLFGYKGAFSSLIGEWFTYFKPSFHPWQHDNSFTLVRFKKEYGFM